MYRAGGQGQWFLLFFSLRSPVSGLLPGVLVAPVEKSAFG